MKIAIDIDDTIFPTTREFIKYHNKKYKTNKKLKDCTTLHANHLFNLDFDTYLERWMDFIKSDFHKKLTPYPFSVKIIKKLSLENELYIVTARNKRSKKITNDLITNVFGENFFKKIIHLNYEDFTIDQKHEVCLKYNIKMIIDDSLETCLACGKEKINCFLFNYKNKYNWNIYNKKNKYITKIDSWKDPKFLNI